MDLSSVVSRIVLPTKVVDDHPPGTPAAFVNPEFFNSLSADISHQSVNAIDLVKDKILRLDAACRESVTSKIAAD